jgi:hypothetical protein
MDPDSTHEEMVLFGGQVRLHATDDGYVRVWQARPARSVGELAELTQAFERSLREARTTRLLLDSRDSEYPRGELQQRLWEWLDQNRSVARVAFVVRSANYAAFVNDNGIGPGVDARAFQKEDAALAWLTQEA